MSFGQNLNITGRFDEVVSELLNTWNKLKAFTKTYL
jgi:hypothetical protein